MKKFKCKICGYVEEKNILKEEFICPKCGVDKSMFEEILEEKSRVIIDDDNPCIYRIEEKCINCGMCYKTCKNIVGIKDDNICIGCGQCRITCPVGAITEKYHYKIVDAYIKNTNKIVIALTSPAIRVSIGDEFGMEAGSFVEKKLVSSIKALGFNYVFDTTFGADLTAVEEANELNKRIISKKNLPMFTSCCPAWVKYTQIYHPTLLSNLSTCKSPIGMQATLIKEYFAKARNIKKEDIIVVALTPCTAKKEELIDKDYTYCDYVLTTSELALYLKEENIDFLSLEDSEYDSILGKGSSSGTLFAKSGGVSEAVIRVLYNLLTKKDLEDPLVFESVNGIEGIKTAQININDINLKIGVIYGLKNVEDILIKLEQENLCDFDFVEVMNCENGCIGGGGQPLNMISINDEILEKRKQSILKSDEDSIFKYSYKNDELIKIYTDFLETPGSTIAYKLLHTTFNDKSYLLK